MPEGHDESAKASNDVIERQLRATGDAPPETRQEAMEKMSEDAGGEPAKATALGLLSRMSARIDAVEEMLRYREARAKPAERKPALGRIVHYIPRPEEVPDNADLPEAAQKRAYAAIITHVWESGHVNLNITDDGAFPISGPLTRTSVLFGTSPGHWMWPPIV